MISPLAKKQVTKDQFRFGIGEWYGQSYVQLTTEQRVAYAGLQALEKNQRSAQACPFRGGSCTKTGGVCSLRLYHRNAASGEVLPAEGDRGMLRATCPSRFLEGGLIFSWIGDVLLRTKDPHVVAEVGFLEGEKVHERTPRVKTSDGLTMYWCIRVLTRCGGRRWKSRPCTFPVRPWGRSSTCSVITRPLACHSRRATAALTTEVAGRNG
jgi:hypothetical protein